MPAQSYWSWLPGNGTSDWSDAKLTPIGIAQAGLASDTWRTQHTDHAMPMPQSYYSSPLERCLQTANHTFSLLVPFMLPSNPFALNIKELFREVIGVHTCDRRSTKTEIEEMWKEKELDLHFEEGFKEKDERWEQEWRETNAGIDRRSVQVLDKVFDSDKNTWISITCHSGVISSMLRGMSCSSPHLNFVATTTDKTKVLNHREFSLQTGGVIPVLVKAETVVGPRVPIKGDDFEKLTMGPAPTLVTA
jgi:broad specificity phosphatase PhoE